jgi:hypothetical protein
MTTYEAGKTYEISHSRKGKLTVKVEKISGEWVHSTIIAGIARGVRGDVLAEAGEDLTFRASLAMILREVPST